MDLRLPAVAVWLLAIVLLPGCGAGTPRFATKAPAVDRAGVGPGPLEGVASYYADEFDGRATANGETYDMNSLTAAHQTLPFNTRVRVTNLTNGKSVVVRVNDRGPFKDDRIIDLSLGAAKKIGLIADGTAPVRLEILEPGTQ